MSDNIRVRIAPSPTGKLHIGNARAALFNWLFAQKNKGVFILRIDDTDRKRSTKIFEDDILMSLSWLGLEWDEQYYQSKRLELYKRYLEQLLLRGKIFWCFHTKEDLKQEQAIQAQKKEAPRHVCRHKSDIQNSKSKANPKSKTLDSKKGILRFAVNENSKNKVVFYDEIRGDIEMEEYLLGDFSVAKGLDEPLYNFTSVIDDIDMRISHVIRGEDHIANTFKQVLLFRALDVSVPFFTHLPVILAPDRSKLSKRHGATAVSEFKEIGYLPEALINYMALLGWRPSRDAENSVSHNSPNNHAGKNEDIFSREELVALFDIKAIHKSGAIFDKEKLDWMNGRYLRSISDERFIQLVRGYLSQEQQGNASDNFIKRIRPLLTERMTVLGDVGNFDYFFIEPNYERALLIWKDMSAQNVKRSLEYARVVIQEGTGGDELRKKLDEIAHKEFGGDRGAIYWPLRAALTGKRASPDPVDIIGALGPVEVLRRVDKAIEML